MDYNTLVSAKSTPGSIADWTNDGRISISASTIVDEAQDWIYRRLRHFRMLVPPVTGVLPTTGLTMAYPSDMLEPDYFILTGLYYAVLKQKTPQEVMSVWSYDGNGNYVPQQPRFYYFDQANFNFDSVPDQAYAYALLYYQMPARLSSANPTNFLTTYCTRLMRATMMMMACEWTKEIGQGQFDRSWYQTQAEEELDRVQAESDRSKRAQTGGWMDGSGSGGWIG